MGCHWGARPGIYGVHIGEAMGNKPPGCRWVEADAWVNGRDWLYKGDWACRGVQAPPQAQLEPGDRGLALLGPDELLCMAWPRWLEDCMGRRPGGQLLGPPSIRWGWGDGLRRGWQSSDLGWDAGPHRLGFPAKLLSLSQGLKRALWSGVAKCWREQRPVDT